MADNGEIGQTEMTKRGPHQVHAGGQNMARQTTWHWVPVLPTSWVLTVGQPVPSTAPGTWPRGVTSAQTHGTQPAPLALPAPCPPLKNELTWPANVRKKSDHSTISVVAARKAMPIGVPGTLLPPGASPATTHGTQLAFLALEATCPSTEDELSRPAYWHRSSDRPTFSVVAVEQAMPIIVPGTMPSTTITLYQHLFQI